MRWRVVCCGPREQAFRRFKNTLQDGGDSVVVLLVDSEEAVATTPITHLQARDGWNMGGIDGSSVHLMVQTMEAWIVADPSALRRYYGQRFNAGALPGATDLEGVRKSDLLTSLRQATRQTQKGTYHKIRHAGDLLHRIDSETVKARCAHCRRVFEELGAMIAAARASGADVTLGQPSSRSSRGCARHIRDLLNVGECSRVPDLRVENWMDTTRTSTQ